MHKVDIYRLILTLLVNHPRFVLAVLKRISTFCIFNKLNKHTDLKWVNNYQI